MRRIVYMGPAMFILGAGCALSHERFSAGDPIAAAPSGPDPDGSRSGESGPNESGPNESDPNESDPNEPAGPIELPPPPPPPPPPEVPDPATVDRPTECAGAEGTASPLVVSFDSGCDGPTGTSVLRAVTAEPISDGVVLSLEDDTGGICEVTLAGVGVGFSERLQSMTDRRYRFQRDPFTLWAWTGTGYLLARNELLSRDPEAVPPSVPGGFAFVLRPAQICAQTEECGVRTYDIEHQTWFDDRLQRSEILREGEDLLEASSDFNSFWIRNVYSHMTTCESDPATYEVGYVEWTEFL